MGCLHVDSWFAHLSPITNFYQPMVCARYTNSTIECPVGQLAVLWRHGGTGRYLCRFFTIDAITNAGGPTAWKIMARASAPCQISDQHRSRFRGNRRTHVLGDQPSCRPLCGLADDQPNRDRTHQPDRWQRP